MAKTTFIATGDAFMTRRLPEGGYPGFDRIRDIIGRHDVRFNNLEFTCHDKDMARMEEQIREAAVRRTMCWSVSIPIKT